jgi:hypothetical protein
VRLVGDEAHVILRDDSTVHLVSTMTERIGGPVKGDDPIAGSFVGLWQLTVAQLEDIRRRVAPVPEEEQSGASRSALVRQAIQSRLARRRRRPSA